MNIHARFGKLERGVKSAFETKSRILSTSFASILSFILIALSGSIGYTTQMFSSGFENWYIAVETLTYLLYLENGISGVALNLIYSVLIGITLTNFYTQIKSTGIKLRNLSGIAPGFIAAGCAGCGIGIISIVGLTGALAILPFNGLLIRLSGLGLLIYFLARTGNPETCSIS